MNTMSGIMEDRKEIPESPRSMLKTKPSISDASTPPLPPGGLGGLSTSTSSPSSSSTTTATTTTKAARFSLDDIKIIEIPKSPADSFSSLYYDDEELAKFRHQAFVEVCDLVVDDDFLSVLEDDHCPVITLTYCTTQLNKG